MGSKIDNWLQDCLYRVQWTLPILKTNYIENQATGKTRPCNVKDIVHETPVELKNVDTKYGRAGKFTNHPANLPTIPLNTDKNNITYKDI